MKHLFYFTFFFSVLLFSCSTQEAEKKVAIRPVKYARIGLGAQYQTKKFNGISKSGTETKLSFRTNGLITLLDAKIGRKIKKGELLAKLDQKDISLAYDKAKTAVKSARSQMELAQSNLERIKKLYQANSASLSDYEQAKNNYSNAQSNYENAKKSLNIQASQFEYAKIIAPENGIITAVNAEINEFVQAASTVFIMNSENEDLKISVGVPEAYISKIKNGDEVSVLINTHNIKGTVYEVGFSSGSTITYPVTVTLINPTDDLRPGMPAEVTFSFQNNKNTSATSKELLIPGNAVGNDQKGSFTFVLKAQEDGNYLAQKRIIELGDLKNQGFVVKSGLKESELVATAGLRTLYDGMIVRLIND